MGGGVGHWLVRMPFLPPNQQCQSTEGTYVDAAYCYRRSSAIGLSVTIVSHAKTAEPIEMPFGLWSWVGPRNHVLYGVHITPREGAILRGDGAAHCKL